MGNSTFLQQYLLFASDILPGSPPAAPISCPWGCRSCRSAQEPSCSRSPWSRPPETFTGLPAAPGHNLCPPDPAPFGPSQAGPGQGRPMGSDCAPGSPEDTSAPPCQAGAPQSAAPAQRPRGCAQRAPGSRRDFGTAPGQRSLQNSYGFLFTLIFAFSFSALLILQGDYVLFTIRFSLQYLDFFFGSKPIFYSLSRKAAASTELLLPGLCWSQVRSPPIRGEHPHVRTRQLC